VFVENSPITQIDIIGLLGTSAACPECSLLGCRNDWVPVEADDCSEWVRLRLGLLPWPKNGIGYDCYFRKCGGRKCQVRTCRYMHLTLCDRKIITTRRETGKCKDGRWIEFCCQVMGYPQPPNWGEDPPIVITGAATSCSAGFSVSGVILPLPRCPIFGGGGSEILPWPPVAPPSSMIPIL